MKQILSKIVKALWVVIIYTCNILSDVFISLIDGTIKSHGFESKFESSSSIANIFNNGLLISKYGKLTRKVSFSNLLITSPTGSGKTTRLLIKMILELKNACIIINDASNEIAPLVSGYKKQQGYNIHYINLSDSSQSCSYNPLDQIKQPDDVNKIAGMLVEGTLDKRGNSDPYWSLQSKVIISLIIRLSQYQPMKFRNLANVLQLLKIFGSNPKMIDTMVLLTKDKQLILDYRAFLSTPQKTLHSIVSSAKASLEMFGSKEICRSTSFRTSIDLDTFRKKPNILFVTGSIGNSKFTNIIHSLIYEQIFTHFLRKLPDKSDLDTFIFLEELPSMSIGILPIFLANCRKYRISTTCVIQDYQQLRTNFGNEVQTIINNCQTKIFLPGIADMPLLKDLETYSGKTIHKDKNGTERIKPLISAEEIRTLPENRSIIISGNKPMILGRTSPYYKSLIYRPMTKIPQPKIISDIPDIPVPLIGIDPINPKTNENPQ